MANFISNLFRAYQINRTARALYNLSDRQLADIGIRRDQIGQHAVSLFGDMNR